MSQESPSTFEFVFEVLKEDCPLRKVLKPTKPCPYYGASGDCATCTYEWMTSVNSILKHFHGKRMNIDLEREKRKNAEERCSQLTVQNTSLITMVNQISNAFGMAHSILSNGIEEKQGDPNVGGEDQG